MKDQTQYIEFARETLQKAELQQDIIQGFENHVGNSNDHQTNGLYITNEYFRNVLVDLDLDRGLNTMPARECLDYDQNGNYTEWKLNLEKNIVPFIKNGLTKPIVEGGSNGLGLKAQTPGDDGASNSTEG